jgi:transmembrane sensor
MTRKSPTDLAASEAADWCARLNNRAVSTDEVEAFYRWRREPANAAAYAETERAWRGARALGTDADIADALGEVLARPAAPSGWWRGWRFQLGVACVALLVLAVIGWSATRPEVIETAVGEQRLEQLADGSRVRLDTNSKVEVRLRRSERAITLVAGQAFFEVAKDARRPFLVTANGSTVRAVGTRFGVRIDGGTVAVVLTEGSVRVADAAAGSTMLRPGQTVTLIDGKVGTPGPADVEALTSWTTGRLIFRDTPLVAAVAEMNRYGRTPIVLATSRAGTLRVNGVFDSGNSDAFIAAASAVSGLRADRTPNGRVRLAD